MTGRGLIGKFTLDIGRRWESGRLDIAALHCICKVLQMCESGAAEVLSSYFDVHDSRHNMYEDQADKQPRGPEILAPG